MTSPYFVTATGTDVGKTYILCDILRQLRGRGRRVQALKPVLSGFTADDIAGTDSGRLLDALGLACSAQTVHEMSPWRFRAPLSPDMAAAREGTTVRLEEVSAFCRLARDKQAGRVFIEGAGGIMSPLGEDFTNLDLACALEAEVLLIAGCYLGSISHTLTALDSLRHRARTPIAIVLSAGSNEPVSQSEMRKALLRFQAVPVYCVPRGGSVPAELIERIDV